ncbi:MAG: adenine-specific methyltransferase EcoRI family protein [Proteobacteria bacterium]|nr:adenine-specific methyltransferase EcoRI family protein [Pseudomonadota bacterium]
MAKPNQVQARKDQDGEFYTRFEDVNNEVANYRSHFKGKVVFCNCDDPDWSNFWIYFCERFAWLGLKKVISTYYNKEGQPSQKLEWNGPDCKNYGGRFGYKNVPPVLLKGDGDFRSDECIALMKPKEVIVCTNPPFSLLGEFIPLMMKHEKKFLVIAEANKLTNSAIRPYILSGEIWAGVEPVKGDLHFRIPNSSPKTPENSKRCYIDDTGQKWMSIGTAFWITNLHHGVMKDKFVPVKPYDASNYKRYDNHPDVIEVNPYTKMPANYKGLMGMAVTFFPFMNTQQFEIVDYLSDATINNNPLYGRLVVKMR